MARTTCRKRGLTHQPSLSENLVAAAAAGSARLPRHTTQLPSRVHITSPRCSGKVTMSRPRTWQILHQFHHLVLYPLHCLRFPCHIQEATMSRLYRARHSHQHNISLPRPPSCASAPHRLGFVRPLLPPAVTQPSYLLQVVHQSLPACAPLTRS